MIAVWSVVLETAACLGLGAGVLKFFRLPETLGSGERIVWAFALGFGILGWCLFFFGFLGWWTSTPLTLFLVGASLGCWELRRLRMQQMPSLAGLDWVMLAILAIVLGADVIEGLAPPADADSLAYHFAIPKDFIRAGHIFFVPRAVDGAIPLLTQMTYIPALALGGERGLTLWTMTTGWAAAAFVFVATHRLLDVRRALAVTLVFLTTPAILYGAGGGQVETRSCLFAFLAALALAEGRRGGYLPYFFIAGLACGFAAGTKYLGLFLVAAVGLVSLLDGRRFAQAAAVAIGAVLAGSQWYWWNWLNTGDPAFPILSGLGLFENTLWPPDFYNWFRQGFFGPESVVAPNVLWLLFYPIKATFDGYPVFESSRTGLGAYVALVFPLALLGAWQYRKSLSASVIFTMVLVVGLFYVLWFLSGSSQRIRHVVPVYPILLVAVSVAAFRFASRNNYESLLASAIVFTIGIQMCGQAIFSLNYVKRLVAGESRQQFLMRNVQGYGAVQWINENLTSEHLVFTLDRQLLYLFDVPVYGGHVYDDATVDLRPSATTQSIFSQLYARGVTHMLFPNTQHIFDGGKQCFEIIQKFDNTGISSRTLSVTGVAPPLLLAQLTPSCPLIR